MNNRSTLTFIFIFILLSGCNAAVAVKSADAQRVVISSQPEYFSTAFSRAKDECKKHNKQAEYIPDANASLDELVFECIGGETEEIIEQTEESETAEEIPEDIEEESAP